MVKKKIIVGAVTLTLLAGAGVGVFAYNNHVEALELERIEKVKKENYEKAEAAILSLYNKDKTSLAENINAEMIANAKKLMVKVEDKKNLDYLNAELKNINTMYDAQLKVQELLNENILADNVSKEQLSEAEKLIEKTKSISETFYNDLKNNYTTANEQYGYIVATQTKVSNLEKNPTRDAYNESIEAVKGILNKSYRDNLSNKLVKINELLTKKENEIKLAKELEKKEKEISEKVTTSENYEKASRNNKNETSSSNNNSVQKKTSSNKSSNESSNVTNKSTNKSSSSTAKSNSSSTSTSNKTSSNKTSGENKNSSSNKPSSSSSSNKPNSGGVVVDGVKKDGGGDIKDSDRTYETGTFTMPDEYYNN
ncbi:hypothetical protein [Metabacillus niabensis]|uniref:hypothetical protein n=1 Tax=Metabacillus niabensis TaxID=324854 RepID=UPI00399F43DD